jgi:hypothetical protein
MSSPSRVKGFTYERELVALLRAAGFEADRMWGSDGRSRGYAKGVDVTAEREGRLWRIQAKRVAKIGDRFKPGDGVDAVMMREDRGDTLVVLRLSDFLDLVQ